VVVNTDIVGATVYTLSNVLKYVPSA
jgi:hypothetical protein